jgi:hypothetical protein
MDKAEIRAAQETLEDLQETLVSRIPRAASRSPDTLLEEIEALNLVIELRMRLSVL